MAKRFVCECGIKFKKQSDLSSHRLSCVAVVQDETFPSKIEGEFKCSGCGKSFWSQIGLRSHMNFCQVVAVTSRTPESVSNTTRQGGNWQSTFDWDEASTVRPTNRNEVRSIGGFSKVREFESYSEYQSHNHAKWMPVGKYQIMGCSRSGKGMVGLKVMLDSSWLKSGMVLTGGRLRAGNDKDAVYVMWMDRGVIPLESYRGLVGYVVSRLREGEQVSVGCIGGHGRTGTLLAGVLAVVEGLTGEQAVKEVRKRYCERAVETKGQENLVKQLRGGK